MKMSVYGLGSILLQTCFVLGLIAGMETQYFFPVVGYYLNETLRQLILLLADLVR